MYKQLFQVNPNYYMILKDSLRSFFVINQNQQWVVTSVDLFEPYPVEEEIGAYSTKEKALQHVLKLIK